MDLNDLMLNIRNIDIESEIKKSISKVKSEYKDLITTQTCKIYSGLLYKELNSKHVPVRLVNTKDLDFSYEHEFLLVNSSNRDYYLIDLTYEQFNNDMFPTLLKEGYQTVDDYSINMYLKIVTLAKENIIYSIDEIYYPKKGKLK